MTLMTQLMNQRSRSSGREGRKKAKIAMSSQRKLSGKEGSRLLLLKMPTAKSLMRKMRGERVTTLRLCPLRLRKQANPSQTPNQQKMRQIYGWMSICSRKSVKLWMIHSLLLERTLQNVVPGNTQPPWKAKKCKDVLTQTLNKMDRLDHYSVFAEEVTEDEAPGYFDIVKKPMDFGTMKEKIDNGDYGSGSSATAAFYEDFMLVFDNCILYNDDGGEVAEEAARLFRHLPETYASACSGLVGKRKNPKVRS
mmetsp:Transcript_6648/g.8702  ORF Transcript_6648/g.8702 Transcript_6648/m.8702 type:complete len:251 (+) Transcript_6648:1-753(+)